MWFPLPELSNFDRSIYINGSDSITGSFIRNRAFYWESSLDTAFKFARTYNEYGFSDHKWRVAKNLGEKRILVIGDSFVESVMSNKTLTQYLEESEDENLEVMNAGMLGTGISRYLGLMTDMASIFKPDEIVLVIYGNDFMYAEIAIPEHYSTPEYYNTWTPRVWELMNQYLKGNAVPFGLSLSAKPLIKKSGDQGFPWNSDSRILAKETSKPIASSMANGTFNSYRLCEVMREERYLQKKMDCLVAMDYFKYCSEKFGFKPFVVFIPSRNQITDHYLPYEYELCRSCDRTMSLTDSGYNKNQKSLASNCRQLGIPFLDLSETIADHEKQGNHLYWNYDGHFNDSGTRVAAEAIREWMVNL